MAAAWRRGRVAGAGEGASDDVRSALPSAMIAKITGLKATQMPSHTSGMTRYEGIILFSGSGGRICRTLSSLLTSIAAPG